MKSLISSLLIIVSAAGVGYVAMRDRGNTLSVPSTQSQSLSEQDTIGLVYMREEEKLARDVYTALYTKWGIQIFSNIASSEQTHMSEVLLVLEKYGVSDPVLDDSSGVLNNAELGRMYQDFVKRGTVSVEEALKVGMTIEELDILDLKQRLATSSNDDVSFLYERLISGSYNHLRAFYSNLSARGIDYKPVYISQGDFDAIISSGRESGPGYGGGRGR